MIATNTTFAAEPIILKHANELIGENTETTNTRTLIGNVQLQQKNVTVTCNSAIQYLNTNRFLLKGNVVIKQDSLTLKSHSVLYDGNTYLATADSTVDITDRKNRLIGKRGSYSTDVMIANFYDEVTLEDDSIKIYANFITYDRKNNHSKAIGEVIVKSKNKNMFLQADTIDNFPDEQKTIAGGNPVLFQIDTIKSNNPQEQLELDTLSVKSDSMTAFRNNENEHYVFNKNVEFVRKDLKAKAEQAIYYAVKEQITLYNNTIEKNDSVTNTNNNQTIVWLDSTQLHSDSVFIKLEKNKLKNIHAYNQCIAVSQQDAINLDRINQLYGNEIILYIENDSLKKIESLGNAKSIFFNDNNAEADGLITSTAEKIIIEMKNGKAEDIYLINQIPGKYYPEPLVNGTEKEFYLPEFKKSDDSPKRPIVKNIEIFNRFLLP